MTHKRIIIDNSVLSLIPSFKSIKFYNQIKLLFSEILVPMEIKNEFAKQIGKHPERQIILDFLGLSNSFYKLCTTYDTVVFETIKTVKGIDKGEAEAVAQYKKIPVFGILSDDYTFWKAAQSANLSLRLFDSLYIFAMLDLQYYLPNRKDCFKEYHQMRKFDAPKLKTAYQVAYNDLSLSYTTRELYAKYNFKNLGLT